MFINVMDTKLMSGMTIINGETHSLFIYILIHSSSHTPQLSTERRASVIETGIEERVSEFINEWARE